MRNNATAAQPTLPTLFPWFGAKRKAARHVWQRFGNPSNYVEPFAGSAAVLLARPDEHAWWTLNETINDADGHVSNIFRALAAAPELVARHAAWPVNEADLTARHLWLTQHRPELTAALMADPCYYDPQAAGWWLWGICAWVGGDWCTGAGPYTGDGTASLTNGGTSLGVYRKMPMASGSHAGRGIHRPRPITATLRSHDETSLPDLNTSQLNAILSDLQLVANRLHRVRVACGDWTRVLNNVAKPAARHITGVFLDPPYDPDERRGDLYAVGDRPEDRGQQVHAQARTWALEHGQSPDYRIAYCSYSTASEDAQFTNAGWTPFRWSASGGYGLRSTTNRARTNRDREVIWFSPHCINLDQPRRNESQTGLFDTSAEKSTQCP